MFKSDELSRSKIKSIVGAGMNEYGGQYAVLPLFKGGYSNALVNSGSGDYDGGDRQIGFQTLMKLTVTYYLQQVGVMVWL